MQTSVGDWKERVKGERTGETYSAPEFRVEERADDWEEQIDERWFVYDVESFKAGRKCILK